MDDLLEKFSEIKILDEHDILENIFTELLNNITFDDKFYFYNKNIKYDLDYDSKIISKIYEKIIIEDLKKRLNGKFKFIENNIQNKYPDFIIISNIFKEKYYAIDIKTTYLLKENKINGFTLGTYKGYFRDRKSKKGIVKIYNDFIKHYCICLVYEREKDISTIVRHKFFKEKWQLASKIPGSGNTCNIGSIKCLKLIKENKSIFESNEEFEKYWSNK